MEHSKSKDGRPRIGGRLIRSVRVDGYLWTDTHGNTYHAVTVDVNGKEEIRTRRTYGYGDSYAYNAAAVMEARGMMPGREHYANGANEAPHQYWGRHGIQYTYTAHTVSARELARIEGSDNADAARTATKNPAQA